MLRIAAAISLPGFRFLWFPSCELQDGRASACQDTKRPLKFGLDGAIGTCLEHPHKMKRRHVMTPTVS